MKTDAHGNGNPYGMKFNPALGEQFRKQGYWGNATLLDCWNMSVLRHPDKPAVIDSHGASLSFSETDAMASKLARFMLDAGIVPGDMVSFQLPGWTEFLPVYIAGLRAGAVLNPIPTNLRYEETRYILSLCESKLLFAPHRFRKFDHTPMNVRLCEELPSLRCIVTVDKFEENPGPGTLGAIISATAPLSGAEALAIRRNVLADDLAAVLFTSGSEGNPKGVMLTHNNIIFSERSFAAYYNITQFDTMLMPAPVTHATGFHHGVTMPFLVGATSVLQDVFVADTTLRLVEQHRCTASMASAPFLHDMVCVLRRCDYDLSSLRFFLCGGAPVNPEMMAEAQGKGILTCNVYGSTESVPHTGVHPTHDQAIRMGTAGKPMPGVEVKVAGGQHEPLPPCTEGQEASRGPQVFMGYFKQPELTAKALDDDGWFYSGDLCVRDADGFIAITGRLKDMIIRGGENISSLEVENILLRHPNIEEAAVVAMPDPRLMERACAYIVLSDIGTGLSFEQMVRFMDGQDIAKHKFPERLEVVRSLPRTASGKIKKAELREDIARKLQCECGS